MFYYQLSEKYTIQIKLILEQKLNLFFENRENTQSSFIWFTGKETENVQDQNVHSTTFNKMCIAI